MSIRTLVVVLLAIACGGVATFGMFRVLQTSRNKSAAAPLFDTESVVVMTVDVGLVGTKISSDMVRVQEWPKDYLPDGYVTDLEQVVNETLRVPVRAGELILEGKVGAGQGMAAIVDPGFRAFTIHTPNHSAGVAGFVMPGDTVDVLLTREDDEIPGGSITTALLQNVKVLASDQMINAPEQNTIKTLKSVTLSVSPEEGKLLTLAQSGGTLTLMLRNKKDLNMTTDGAITWRDIERTEQYAREQLNLLKDQNLLSQNSDGAQASNELQNAGAVDTGSQAVAASDSRDTGKSDQKEEVELVSAEVDWPTDEAVPQSKRPLKIRTLRGLSTGEIYAPRESSKERPATQT